jgi:hypothetical protein
MDKKIRNIVKSVLREWVEEDTKVLTNGNVEIDNFSAFAKLLNGQTSDDVWYVTIVKRKKDNPQQKQVDIYLPQYYLFSNSQEMLSKEDEIKNLCTTNNARAYFYPNKRNKKEMDDYVKVIKASSWGKKYKGVELRLAAGQSKPNLPNRDMCFLDIDTPDKTIYQKVLQIFNQFGITPVHTYRSANLGWHILLPDKKDADAVKRELQKQIDDGYPLGRYSTVGMELDKPLLLYCNLSTNGYGKQNDMQSRLKQAYDKYQRETDPYKKGEIGKWYTKRTGVDLRKEKRI